MAGIGFDGVTKLYDAGEPALVDLEVTIEPGELFSFVGPSGCGKTTALRVLAGLEEPTTGRVRIDGRDVTEQPAHARNLGLVTQDNQLFRHRSAGGNIRFPLEVRNPDGHVEGFDSRLRDEAAELRIEHLLDAAPKTLSAGQRRLVQLARAVIARPAVLLMDEPFGFLDDQVHLRLRSEIMRINRDRQLTSILVTASQHDAMAMSDRIAVLFDGVVHQIGSPDDVYHRPETAAVARFFGEPAMNVVPARVNAGGEERRLDFLGWASTMWSPLLDRYRGREVLVGFRPHDMVPGDATTNSVEVRITATEPLGRETMVAGSTPDGTTVNGVTPGQPPPIGMTIDFGVRADRLHVFDPVTGGALLHPVGQTV